MSINKKEKAEYTILEMTWFYFKRDSKHTTKDKHLF